MQSARDEKADDLSREPNTISVRQQSAFQMQHKHTISHAPKSSMFWPIHMLRPGILSSYTWSSVSSNFFSSTRRGLSRMKRGCRLLQLLDTTHFEKSMQLRALSSDPGPAYLGSAGPNLPHLAGVDV